MTDAELWELILISQANAATYFAIFLTLVSGYLVVAYCVGSRLLGSQISIVNVLFIVSVLTVGFATYAALSRASFLLGFVGSEYTSPLSAGINYYPIAGLAMLAMKLICLVFMWQIRHPKRQL